MNYVYSTLIGYLIGSFNPAYILAKLRGFDIRKKGSGNAGASNALILFGKVRGIACALLDIAKAFLAILLTEKLFPSLPHILPVTGVACILGHVFPFYMKFKGGKGLACIGGMILYYDWRVFLLMLASEIVVVLLAGYICFVPTSASVVFPIVYAVMTKDLIGAVILLSVAGVIFWRHIENFKRIRVGTEIRMSYLWRPQKEMERMKSHLDASEDEVNEHFAKKADKK